MRLRSAVSIDCKKIYIFDGFLDDVGRAWSVSTLPPGDHYVDDLDIPYIYILSSLLKAGYKNEVKAFELPRRSFRIALTGSTCSHIDICRDDRSLIRLISYRAKFAVPMSDDSDGMLPKLAEAFDLGKPGLGADAYALFLSTLFTKKEREAANYGLVREIFPELPYSFNSAKKVVAGIQYAAAGRYKDIYSYDIHRAYTYSMLGDVPQGAPLVLDGYVEPRANQWAIYQVAVAGMQPLDIDPICWQYNKSNIYWLPLHIFHEFEKNNSFSFFEVTHTYLFKTRRNLFDRFFARTEDIAAAGGIAKKYAKRLANALVGYLGRNERDVRDTFYIENGEMRRKAVNCPSKAIYAPAYINILDRHKHRFFSMLRAAGLKDIIYINTDGFMTSKPLDLARLNIYPPSGSIGALREAEHYADIHINAVNQYAGITAAGAVDNCISGLRLEAPALPDELASGDLSYYINLPTADGCGMQRLTVSAREKT